MRRARSSSFVFPRERDDSDDVRDARRLFYVALTRAKKHAVIISSGENNLGKQLLPLRFIDELEKKSVSQKNIPAEEEKTPIIKIADLKSGREKEIVEYAKRSILEKGLSVTALNHFLNCPSEFLYKSILKIPEAPSATSEKGIAMHKALSLVWSEKHKSVENIQKTIEKSVKDYFKVSLLPSFEKGAILAELLDSAPKVATALQEYFNMSGEVFTEKWFEKNFHSKSEKIDFELHGQLDAVLETDKKVEVFDYKTREAMSENAIKGMTKDSDGNYFRQLVFYKMLLLENSRYKGKEIEPSLIFVKPDSKGRCPTITLPISKTDIEKVEGEVENLVKSVFSGNFLYSKCDDLDCKWCAMKSEFLN